MKLVRKGKVCIDIQMCDKKISKDWFKKYCNGDFVKCFRYKDRRTVELTPEEWLEKVNEPETSMG